MTFKKIFLGLFSIAMIVLAMKIGRILVYDFNRLTPYGFGYLTGLIILFLITAFITVYLAYKIFSKKRFSQR